MRCRKTVLGVVSMWLSIAPVGAMAQDDWREDVGYDDLVDRIGLENVPTGLDVHVAHVEFLDITKGYAADPKDVDLLGKSWRYFSGDLPFSNHATRVGQRFYGTTMSLAPDIVDVVTWEKDHFVEEGFLHTGNAAESPRRFLTPVRVICNAWGKTYEGDLPLTNEGIRRFDWVIERDGLLSHCAITGFSFGNEEELPNWIANQGFNQLSVGQQDGDHALNDTIDDLDGPGRMKPQICGAAQSTSQSTGLVSGMAAALVETARTAPLVRGDVEAQRPEVIQAAMLAGATHASDWTNNAPTNGYLRGITARPLDDRWGAGLMNINLSHQILTAGQTPGSATVPRGPTIAPYGWDYAPLVNGDSLYYGFEVRQRAAEISVIARWHRRVSDDFSNYALADIDLVLWRLGQDGQLKEMWGAASANRFAFGNSVSNSRVDPVEHLYIRDLEPGGYVLQVRRLDQAFKFRQWPVAIAWSIPEATPILRSSLPMPGEAGVSNRIIATGATPGETIHFVYAWTGGSTEIPGCPGLIVDMRRPIELGSATADEDGVAFVDVNVPADGQGRTFRFSVAELETCRISPIVEHEFR